MREDYNINININGVSSSVENESNISSTAYGAIGGYIAGSGRNSGGFKAIKNGESIDLSSLSRTELVRNYKRNNRMIQASGNPNTSWAMTASNNTLGLVTDLGLELERRNAIVMSNAKKVTGGALAAGAIAYDWYKTGQEFKGHQRNVAKMNNIQKGVSMSASILTAGFVAGGIGAVAATGYLAFQMAKENRKFINDVRLDKAKSDYHSRRVIKYISDRRR